MKPLDDTELTSMIIFFLTLNPLCIGLVVAFAYTYIEGVKDARAELGKISLAEQNKEHLSRIATYCVVTDRVIFNASMFWLASMTIGIGHYACRVGLWGRHTVVPWLYLLVWVVVGLVSVLVYVRAHGSKGEDEPWHERCADPTQKRLWAAAPPVFNVLVLAFCLFLVGSNGSDGNHMISVIVTLLLSSVLYLFVWFLLAAVFMPSRALEILREKKDTAPNKEPPEGDTEDPEHPKE